MEDLIWLSGDEDSYVRMNAYYALGRASILEATKIPNTDKDVLERTLEVAVTYFEKSSQEGAYLFSNPAKFCYPFYRSYYAIVFQDAKEDEVQRYLSEAKKSRWRLREQGGASHGGREPG